MPEGSLGNDAYEDYLVANAGSEYDDEYTFRVSASLVDVPPGWWREGDGTLICILEMVDSHLIAAIKMCIRLAEKSRQITLRDLVKLPPRQQEVLGSTVKRLSKMDSLGLIAESNFTNKFHELLYELKKRKGQMGQVEGPVSVSRKGPWIMGASKELPEQFCPETIRTFDYVAYALSVTQRSLVNSALKHLDRPK